MKHIPCFHLSLFTKESPAARTVRGFTAVELMVVIAILGILAAFSLPSWSGVMDRNRVSNSFDELSDAINFARSEGVRRGATVTLLQGEKSNNCRPEAKNSKQEWSCGWKIFVDNNNNDKLDQGEPVLREGREFKGVTVMHAGGAEGYITFNPSGYTNNTPGRFVIYPAKAGISSSATTTLCLERTARIKRVAGEATCE